MQHPLTIAILAGLGGMIGWGMADFFAKKTVDAAGAIKGLVWAHVWGTGILLLVALLQYFVLHHDVALPASATVWLGLAFFGALQMIVYWLAYQGFEKGQLAVMSPIFASYSGIVALFSFVFFHEHATIAAIVALALLFSGILLVNLDIQGLRSKKLNLAPGLQEISAAAVLAAVWTLGWDRFVNGQDSLAYSLIMYACMTVAAICLARVLSQQVTGITKGVWKFLALSGLGEAVAYLSVTWGYSATGLTGVVALISGAFTVPTVILAYVFLKERITKLQVFAVMLIIIGVIAVSFVG